jgi:hypothetical protein
LVVSLVPSLQLPYGPGRGESQEPCVLKHDPAKPHCFLTHCSLNPEAKPTNVSEETLSSLQLKSACRHPAHHKSAMGQVYPGRPNPLLTRTTLRQLCTASWVFLLQLAVTQPGIEPRSVVMPQALQCLKPQCHLRVPCNRILRQCDLPTRKSLADRLAY